MGLKAKNIKINGIEYSLSGNVDVVDNLTTADSASALSANQGKVLNDKIESIESESVVANYDKETGTMKLEFNVPVQGVIEDTLDSTNQYNALSANQGRVLNEKIDSVEDTINSALDLCGTVDLLADFNGRIATEVTIHDMSVYKQLSVGICVVESDGYTKVIGTGIIPRSTFVSGGMTLQVFGGNESTWGLIKSTESNTSIICNRTSETTHSMKIWGIR